MGKKYKIIVNTNLGVKGIDYCPFYHQNNKINKFSNAPKENFNTEEEVIDFLEKQDTGCVKGYIRLDVYETFFVEKQKL